MAGREVWSLFTGAMGFDLGLEQAGVKVTLAVEKNPVFCATIRKNRPYLTLLEADVCRLSGDSLRAARGFEEDVFLLAGGPPCQTFSPGGKRAALSDPRGNLIYEFLRLVGEVRPRYFVLENVANILTAALRHRPIADRPGQHWSLKRYSDPRFNGSGDAPPLEDDELGSSAIRQILRDIGSLHYDVIFGVLDAAEYGAPQRRLRFVMIGSREGPRAELPAPEFGADGSPLPPFRTVRGAIADIENGPGAHSSYTPRVRKYFEMVPEGGNWRCLPGAIQHEALGNGYAAGGGKTGFYRRLAWDRPSPTITGRANRKGSALCHPSQHRPLSVRECARLQGFPDDWEFSGSMNAQYLQVGNAVPLALGKAVGLAILQAHRRKRARRVPASARDYGGMLAEALHKLRSAACNKKAVAAGAPQRRFKF